MKNRFASHVALLVVIGVVGGCFFWWFRQRPSYLLYQAHRGVGGETQVAAIDRYTRLLSSNTLTPEDEIKYRLALGELYVRAAQENTGISLRYKEDPNTPVHPFLMKARKEFDRVIALEPANASAHYYLGRLLWAQNLEVFAIRELEESCKNDPSNSEALRFLSIVQQERGNASAGRELALEALAIDPSSDEARMALVHAYALLGDRNKSLQEYERLSSAYREMPAVRAEYALELAKQNFWTEAGREIDAAMTAARDNGEVTLFYGRVLLERGLVEEAAGAFANAQALMPKSAWPLVWRAQAQALRGDCEDAQRNARLLTDGLPRWPWGRWASAWAAACRGDERKILLDLDEALRLSDLPEAAVFKANVLLDRGQYDELGRLVRPMLDQDLLKAEAHVFLAQSFLAQGKASVAAEMAETAIHLNQRDHRALAALAEARAALGDAAGATRAFDNAVGLNPFDSTLAAQVAAFRGRTLGDDGASSALRAVLERDPRNPRAWFYQGALQLKREEWSDAAQSFLSAIALRPYLLKAHLGLAEAYFHLGQRDRADSALTAALAVNSRSPDIAALRAKWRR